MSIPAIIKNSGINAIFLYKLDATTRISKVLSSQEDRSLIKTASTDQSQLIGLFIQMLSALNIKVNAVEAQSVMDNLTKSGSIKKSSDDKKEEIKIVSKSIKDSHYQIDISKDLVNKDNKSVFMVSCYARDAYLGRYLIKRNYFYTQSREAAADDAYEEIVKKSKSIRERYYNGVIDISEIFPQMKKSLDGVIAEIKIEEDDISSTLKRN